MVSTAQFCIDLPRQTLLFQIGAVSFKLILPENLTLPQTLNAFISSDNTIPQITCELILTDQIGALANAISAEKISGLSASRDTLSVFMTRDGECRFCSFAGTDTPYAISQQTGPDSYRFWFDKTYQNLLCHETIFFSIFSLEKHMISQNGLILHTAWICHHGKAILFSAPSQTGKSTQASLWQKYRNSRIINGDRALISRTSQGWIAQGWPICGSSEICHNEKYPIETLVMLKQGPANTIRPITGMQALRQIYSQLTINSWDSIFQNKAMDLAEQLIAEIPIYELTCTISEEAVQCLEQQIRLC